LHEQLFLWVGSPGLRHLRQPGCSGPHASGEGALRAAI